MSYDSEKYKITEAKEEIEGVKFLRVKCNLNPAPGQFFQASIQGIGECPLAPCSYNKEYLEILVRNAGSLTGKICRLKKGDFIWIRGNYGKGFPLDNLERKNIILVAGGTGIAPVASFLDYIDKNIKKPGKILVYFGFRDEKHILVKKKLKKWSRKFRITICLDKKTEKNNYEEGFINQIIQKSRLKASNYLAFMCGPEVMMKNVTETLNNLGMKNNSIFWSMERRMECAMGNCGRCLIQDVYVCKDGPVFRYDKIKPKLDNEESSNKILIDGK